MAETLATAVRPGLLIVGHGSRRAEANAVLAAVAAQVADQAGLHAVQHAFLELGEPLIAAGFALLAERGCDHIVVHPYFLYPGNHTMTDIPAALTQAGADHPEVGWTMTEPLDADPRLVAVVLDRVAAVRERA